MAEASQMSTMQSTMQSSIADAGGAGGAAADAAADRSHKIFGFLMVASILLFLAIVGVKMSSSLATKNKYDDSDNGDEDDSKPPSGPSFYVDPTPPPPSTTRRTRKSTTTRRTPSPSADKFSESPGTLQPPKPQPGEQKDTILCVVGQDAVVASFPEDGLCDLTFYADVDHVGGVFTATRNPASWVVFQAVAQQSKKTAYGLSADISPGAQFDKAFNPRGNGKVLLKQCFDKNIAHYGVLNAEGSERSLTQAAEGHKKLGLIHVFRQLLVDWATPNNHLVVGIRFSSYSSYSQNSAKAAALKTIISKLTPTIVVMHTHVKSWKSGQRPVCMTSWDYPISRSDEPNMKDVATQVIPNSAIPEKTIVMTSFTMAAQIFKTGSPYHWSKHDFQATAFDIVKYVQVCKGVIKYKDFDSDADLYIWSHDSYFSFCAETTETIVSKAKKWFKGSHVPKNHGLAFFDVDLDDFDNSCRNGSYSRIKEVKDYLGT